MFGIKFWGECWSGPNAQDTFFAQGAATDCNNDQCCDNQCYGQCRLEDSYCTGRHLTAAVYGIVDESDDGSAQDTDINS